MGEDKVKVGYGNWFFQANSPVTVVVGAIILVGFVIMWGLNRNELIIREGFAHNKAIITDGHADITEELKVQTYLLSLPPENMPKLTIPKSLIDRVR